jgi:hypothetical protein
LAKLEEAGLYVKAEKCEFSVSQTTFLGFIVSADDISMDPAKIQAIREWEAPKNVRDVQCFLGYKELLAMESSLITSIYPISTKKVAFEEWRPHLLGTKDPILVLTDHNNL